MAKYSALQEQKQPRSERNMVWFLKPQTETAWLWRQEGNNEREETFGGHSLALAQRLLSSRRDLPVAVNHLHDQPELKADDGDVHHHLGQDGRHSSGDCGDTEGDKLTGSDPERNEGSSIFYRREL